MAGEKKKKTLSEKWNIPIDHLDFEYIKQCENSKELERICQILQTGEEGYYPALTKCAEERLKDLKPHSKIFRTESPAVKANQLDSETSKQIQEKLTRLTQSAKERENELKACKNDLELNYPSIRQPDSTETIQPVSPSIKKPIDRIKSSEYQKWDKYDADAEVLKIDLQEEIQKEKAARKEVQKIKKKITIEEIKSPVWEKLTMIEREELSLKHKIKGNEYFKTKDYADALQEYSRCLEIFPSAIGFNNRAITNIKLGRLKEAVNDCDECLKLDPQNVKAHLRKAEALQLDGCKRSAYNIIQEVLEIDPKNTTALKTFEKLKKELPDLPPTGAYRMQIEEIPSESELDLAKLIVPNKIVRNKASTLAQNLGKLCAAEKKKENQKVLDKKINNVLAPLCAEEACESREAFIEEIFD
ncbi:sperm-associated antigen 1 [Sergentomyia squamirostris]